MKQLDYFFNPKSVAIIGASHNPEKLGYAILANFVKAGFERKIYPVNPNTEPILGLKVYKSVLDIPDDLDLVVIVVPAKIVPRVLRECVKKKIEAIIVISAGFSEIGEEGKKLEIECKKIIKGMRTRVMGPNCLGVYDPYTNVDTLFLSRERCGRPKRGNIAFISQSGAVGSTILDWLSEQGIGISKFISYGNAMDLDDCDFLEYLGDDEKTKVITVYLEGIEASGQKFMRIARRVTKKKPVIILKAGKTKKGAEAVFSHTGSLGGSAKIYSAAFKQAGIIEADSWEELFDFARAFSTQPLPKENRIAIVTDGGGFGVLATDEAERQGLELPEPSDKLKKEMSKVMPSYASMHNPIDLTGDADADRYRVVIETCLRSKEYDGVIAITLFQVPTLEKEVVDHIIKLHRKYKKPLLACAAGGKFTQELSEKLMEGGVPVYPTPERAVKAMKALVEYSWIKFGRKI
jgi:acetyl coenzyme A synthetase (ADP forming)-like protein